MSSLRSPSGAAVRKRSADGHEPCVQIQMDLSAMLDGELDTPSVRRVMVHSDVCPACASFLRGIRRQLRANLDLHRIEKQANEEEHAAGAGRTRSTRARELRRQLMENRAQLARILYEMGRGFVLMGVSPNFTREVAREPVPIPDLYLRGCNLLDEVERLSADSSGTPGEEWVRAKSLFDRAGKRDPKENLEKGKRLLREALMLQPDFHQARIYLGHAHHVEGERAAACREFRAVLEATEDPLMRAFALENLGNVFLENGDPRTSLPFFLAIVESGVIGREPRFFTTYFNLGLAYGLLEDFASCREWLGRLYEEFPHKRRLVARELVGRERLHEILRKHEGEYETLVRSFPEWFPTERSP